MSFKIGGFLSSSSGSDQIGSNTARQQPIADTPPERYAGGRLQVEIKSGDTQQTFVRRGFHDHAIKAGLDETEANQFADKWANKNTTLNHYAGASSTPFTEKEFQNLKTKAHATGKTDFDLLKDYDPEVLADLNQRVNEFTVVADETVAYTPPERTALLAQKAAGANQAAITEKPILTLIDGKTSDGKPIDVETALTRYVQQTYNPKPENGSRRVWGDKINEMVSQAKTDGVAVDLKFNEDGTALVGINAADKQKLDGLFNDALGKTILGEKGSEKAQKEETGQVVDIPIMAVRGVINTANHTTEPVRGTLELLGVDASGLKLPKPEYQSEFGKKNGLAGEIGTEIGVGIVSAPALLKTAAGKVIAGVSGVYNVSTGAAGVDPTEKGEDGKFRQMGKLESDLRIVGGAAELFGAKPAFKDTAIAGKTTKQTEEVVAALTPDGRLVKVRVPTTQTATEAAMAKPTQSADDLVSEMSSSGSGSKPPMGGASSTTATGGTTIPNNPKPITQKTLEHIFHGEINKKGNAVGFHSDAGEMQAINRTRATKITKAPDKNGVYVGEVEIQGLKKKGVSSFFPDSWSKNDVVNAVKEAYSNKISTGKPNQFIGTSSSGVKIGMYLNPDGTIATAYALHGK